MQTYIYPLRLFLYGIFPLILLFSINSSLAQSTANEISSKTSSNTLIEQVTPEHYKLIDKLTKENSNHKIQSVTSNKIDFVNHQNNSKKDVRNLPLNEKGNLLSYDGNEVEFRVPLNEEISKVCYTPNPIISEYTNRDASCGYIVPCDNPANRDATDFTTIKYFQLEWHVMRNASGASSNINQATIDDLMIELNADFASHNMVFCADPANFYTDVANYTHNANTEEFSLKNTYNVTPSDVINIYVVGSMASGGYARFPYDPAGGTSSTGGIVLNRGNCVLGTHTLAHEMGHVFGLAHTFSGVDEQSNCSSCYEKVRNVNGSSNTSGVPTPLGGPYTDEGDREGDWCSDTNPHDTYAYNCFTSSNSNGACDSNPWANAPVNNHMSYSFCSSQFTNQQSRRMHCMINTYLSSWTSYGGGICGTNPPNAEFSGTPTTWQAPASVNFNDESSPTAIITNWTWVFDTGASNTVSCVGCTGANATYVGQNPPTVTYSAVGNYTVSLTTSSANGNDTETKTDYVTVTSPAGDCDTLLTQWETPAPSISSYFFGPGDNVTGIPCATLSPFPNTLGVYETYASPNPGVTPVGGVRVGLGNLVDANDNTTFQVVIYNDDGAGGLLGAPIGGVGGLSPTQLGIPGSGFYDEIWIPFLTPVIPATSAFHVGVEIFPGDATDELTVMSSATGQGQGAGLNNAQTANFGYVNYNTFIGIDFDLDIVPMLGEYAPLPVILGFTENVVCDTTYVTLYTDAFYSTPTSWSFSFDDGSVINTTSNPITIDKVYTSAGPELVTITAINDCGRESSTTWQIPYNFLSTPDAEFSASPNNPVCLGDLVTFSANTSGYANYEWDFGDGTVISTNNASPINHTYASSGLYYVELSTTEAGFEPADTFYLEDFESGWPAGYFRFNNDIYTPDPAVNPPFTGSNATAWLTIDGDGNGDTEAVSTSWNGSAGQLADDWMITQGLGALPANQRLFWDAQALDVNFPDGYEVRISTTQLPANTTNYNTVLFSTSAENAFNTTRSVDLSAYAGQTVYIAFRNNSNWMNLLFIDDIRIGTATTGCSANILKTDYIEIIDCSVTAPTAAFTNNPVNGCGTNPITFTDASVIGDPPTSWLWNFGDGTFSTVQNPVHTFPSTGTSYTVTLQACNSGGCTSTSSTVTIYDLNVSVNGVVQPTCGNTGQFVINATDGSGSYSYSIDNGTTFSAPSSNINMPDGTYNIIVRDDVTSCQVSTTVVLTNSGTPSTNTVNDTICANSIYTLPSGATVMGPGSYMDTIPGASCDSIITFNLTTSPSSLHFGLYAATFTDYHQVNPLSGAIVNTYSTSANTLGWINGAFTMHEQDATAYWISDNLLLQSLDLTNGIQNSITSEISTLPFFWGLRYYNGYIYTVTTATDNDKMLVRIDPNTGDLDTGFPGIEINGSASTNILFSASPVINPITGIFYLPLYENALLSFDINSGTGSLISLSGYGTPNGLIHMLEINEHTGDLYAISNFTDIVSISNTGVVALIKTLTSASGFSNPVSAFDSDNELYIFQAESGCATQSPLVAIDVNTGQEYCNNPPVDVFTQMEYLNCKPASTLRTPKEFEVSIYPNPTLAEISIELEQQHEDEIYIQVFDISGNFMFEKSFEGKVGNNLAELDFSNLVNGIYHVVIRNSFNQTAKKVVKL